jgi:hypothetical protein
MYWAKDARSSHITSDSQSFTTELGSLFRSAFVVMS